MSSQLTREAVRWTVIVSSGGLALYLLGQQIVRAFQAEPGLYVGYIGMALAAVLVCGPLFVTAYGCLKRDYASVIEVWSVVVGILVCGALANAVHYLNPLRWIKGALMPSAAFAPWTILADIAMVIAAAFVLLSPFVLGREAYRFCRRLGYQYLPNQPPRWLRHVG